jgi:hypothetical protein
MAIALPPGAEARALLHHILEHGDLVGRDTDGRTIIQLAVEDSTLETLMAFDADAADLEDEGEGEPDDDAEEDGPAVMVELVRPKLITLKGSRPRLAKPATPPLA